MFAAVVVGGTRSAADAAVRSARSFGAYILMIVVNILLVLNVSAYYSTIAEGVILILAVLGGLDPLASRLCALHLRASRAARSRAWRAGRLPVSARRATGRLRSRPGSQRARVASRRAMPNFFVRNAETLRYALPAYVCFVLVVVVTQITARPCADELGYCNSLIVLTSFLAILALGQGTVILTGGLDLSVPWTIGLSGILLAGMVKGSDEALLYALPIVLAIGLRRSASSMASAIVLLGMSPIVMTLAINGILQGAALRLFATARPPASPRRCCAGS